MASLENRLDAAIGRVLAGEQIANLHPELRPLLMVGANLLDAPLPAPTRQLARPRLRSALDVARRRKHTFWLPLWFSRLRVSVPSLKPSRLLPLAAAMVLIFVVFLSGNALPGQPQYRIKQGVEAVRLLLPRNPAQQATFYTKLADRRLGEIERSLQTGRPVRSETLSAFASAWQMAEQTMSPDQQQLRIVAAAHVQRLQKLAPSLTLDLQPLLQTTIAQLTQFALNPEAPPPSPPEPAPAPAHDVPKQTPSPSPTLSPQSTLSPTRQAQLTGVAPPGQVPSSGISPPSPTPTVSANRGSTPLPTPDHPGDATPADQTPSATSVAVSPQPTGTSTPTPEHTPAVKTTTPTPSSTAPRSTTTTTATATFTPHPSQTPEFTPTPTPTGTRTPTPSLTETPGSTRTPTLTSTRTPTPPLSKTPGPPRTSTPTSGRPRLLSPRHPAPPTHRRRPGH